MKTVTRQFKAAMVVLAIASAMLFSPALAQTSTPDHSAHHPGTPTAEAQQDATPGEMMPGGPATPAGGMQMAQEFDLMFIDMMTVHHEGAIAMAEVALELAEHPELAQLADEIIVAQQAEIDTMRSWRDAWYADAPEMSMDQMMGGMDMMMQMMEMMPGMQEMAGMMDIAMMGMMSPEQQAQALREATESFDLAFLNAMIPHHLMALMMTEMAAQQAVHPELAELSDEMFTVQQEEIATMRNWRQTWSVSVTPEAAAVIADQADLLRALVTAGLVVKMADPVQQPFLTPQSFAITQLSGGDLAGPADVQIFEYADVTSAQADAAQIGPDGNPRTSIVEWIAPPHFFQAGRIIVLYVGDDAALVEILAKLLGAQFAGA